MKKVLFLHLGMDHYAYHITPIAAELSQFDEYEVTLCGVKENFPLIEHILNFYPDHTVQKWIVRNYWFRQQIERFKYKTLRPKHIFKRYKKEFKQYDMVICPTLSFVWMRKYIDSPNLLMAYSAHGAGDGYSGFFEEINGFDLWLLSGTKLTDRLRQLGRAPKKTTQLIGYPKFDLLEKEPARQIFDNKNKTFLYNPHFRKGLSSYYDWALEMLEFFKAHPEYNLIFAPHIVLFNSELSLKDFPKEYMNLPNIHFDSGSEASVNMTYSRLADVYIGDASSQVYEFLFNRRPCIFLNPNKINWKETNDFYHWRAGEVLDDFSKFPKAIASCFDLHSSYVEAQNMLFETTFELTNELSGKRAARAIDEFLKTEHS